MLHGDFVCEVVEWLAVFRVPEQLWFLLSVFIHYWVTKLKKELVDPPVEPKVAIVLVEHLIDSEQVVVENVGPGRNRELIVNKLLAQPLFVVEKFKPSAQLKNKHLQLFDIVTAFTVWNDVEGHRVHVPAIDHLHGLVHF